MNWIQMIWVFAGVIIGILLILIIIKEKNTKCRVRIKEITSDSKIIKNVYRASEFLDERGVLMWKLKMPLMEAMFEKNKMKKSIPQPPEQVIEIDRKGNKWADCYMFESGEVVFAKDNIKLVTGETLKDKLRNFPKDVQLEIDNEKDLVKKKELISKYRKQIIKELEKEQIVFPYEPITTNQRIIYIDNIRKAEQRRNKKDLMQQIISLALIGMCVMMVIGVIIFIENLTAPAKEANSQRIEIQKIETEQIKILRDIYLGQQNIENSINSQAITE